MSGTGHEDLTVRHPDRRVSRTLTAVVEALTIEARERPVRDISVKDLVDRAKIGRSTFYEHFESIESLLLWLVDELVEVVHDADGRFQLDELLRFVASMPEVTSAFLEIESCAARCRTAMAAALPSSDPEACLFAAAGTMALLGDWLDQDDRPPSEGLVQNAVALVAAVTDYAAGTEDGELRTME